MFGRISSDDSNESRVCNKSPDIFCFLCAIYIVSDNSLKLTEHYRKLYNDCYNEDVSKNGADKPYSSNKLCKSCAMNLSDHQKNKKSLKYLSPARWNSFHLLFKPHEECCYVCVTNLKSNGKFIPKTIEYPKCSTNVIPAVANVLESFEHLNKKARLDMSDSQESSHSDTSQSNHGSEYEFRKPNEKTPTLITQPMLNTLVRLLDLSKETSELLASFLWHCNLLTPDCRVTYFRDRNNEILQFFKETNNIPYLKDIKGYFDWLNIEYKPDEWRLFIDSNVTSLKCVLLHNTNQFPSIPLLYSATLKENYTDIKKALKLIDYATHGWMIIADLKLLNILCGIGCHSSTNPCLFCDWRGTYRSNKLDQQYDQPNLQPREEFVVGVNSVTNEPMIPLTKVLLPALHIKIGLIAQFVKKMYKDYKDNGRDNLGFQYLQEIFYRKSEAKLQAGIFNGPDIRNLLNHADDFREYLTATELRAFNAFEEVCTKFLGKNRSENYKSICVELGDSFRQMGCNNSTKMHYLHKHIDKFPPDCSDYSDEMGERFHQDIMKFERRYQGRYSIAMLSDYCWTLKQEVDLGTRKCSRKSLFPSFSNVE